MSVRQDGQETFSSDYPFESKFADIYGSKIHYIEQGEGRVFLFLHGNPTWSYLWRNIIPTVSRHGRCIALDLVGFGKSDKPDISYKFLEHYRYVEGFIEKMGLKDVVIVGHDWGGVLGFYYAMNHRENMKGIAFMESFPFTFTWDYFPPKFRTGFRLFRMPLVGKFLIMVMNVFVNNLIPASVDQGISKEVLENYQKPFPTMRSRYPIYVWPNELPVKGKENDTFREIQRLEEYLPLFNFPMLLLTSSPGGVIRKERVEWLKRTIKDLTIKDIGVGIHFVQEDNPGGISQGIIEWVKKKRLV